jgi:RNA-directed DNA polymerase
MTTRREPPPATVPFAATPAGEPRSVRTWANPCVWTDRMLTALETGVKGGRWHTLIDKVFSRTNLFVAASKVVAHQGAPGVDHVSVEAYESRLLAEVDQLGAQLRNETYRPQAVRRVRIPKPGTRETRPLGIPTVRDRVVQTALLHVLEPIFDMTFAEHSYGFRHHRGCHDALRRVEALLDQGHVWVVDADLKSYFDTIPHERLMDRIREKVSDRRILKLVEQFLQQGVMEDLALWTPEEGTPQGAVISPLLANIYLTPLDHLVAAHGFELVRYADDFVILCRSREEAERALEQVQQWVADNGLVLHPTKTRIADARTDGFDFLGYRFRGMLRLPREKSLTKLKDTVRIKTRRTRGDSLDCIIASLNSTLRGWFRYFRHCHANVFTSLDRWIRGRLRSILRRRAGRRGRALGADHQRWPNAYFHELKLYCLTTTHARFRQSCLR